MHDIIQSINKEMSDVVKKSLKISLVVIVGLIVVSIYFIHSWKQTPYGKLDTKVAMFLKISNYVSPDGAEKKPDGTMDYLATREQTEKFSPIFSEKPVELPVVRDIKIVGPGGDIPIRVYAPQEKGAMPMIVYYHGGGWVIGSIKDHDGICRRLAQKTGFIVLSVDYRLAPENKYPAAIEDAYAALVYASKNAIQLNGDASKIAVAGDSAGGNLAAVVSLMARDKNGPKIAYQILLYPVTNIESTDTQSYNNFASGYFLTKWQIQQFITYYIKNEADKKNPYASPLLVPNLHGLPPAIVLTAQFDPLRDEGEAYANKLMAANVPVVNKRFNGVIHAFMSISKITGVQYNEAMDIIADNLHKAYKN
jgi:acetyl esterase